MAMLDRISREVYSISGLIEQRVPLIIAELGADADLFMLPIDRATIKKERSFFTQQTTAALAANG
jgi:hypothetical protein